MELIYVREFVVLAETCNFQIAAESLSMSQSALSKHIQKLEEDLNISLFDRSKRSAVLSEGGRIFLEYARPLCQLADECDKALSSHRNQSSNTLRIGFIKKLGQYNLIEKLTEFSLDHPEIQTSLFDQNGDQVKAKLSSGECDIIFTAEADEFSDDEYEKLIYQTERMVVLLPEDHPLSGREQLSIKDIENEKLIAHSTPLEQKLFNQICARLDTEINIVGAISSSTTIMKMVSQDMGISIISDGSTEQFRTYGLAKVPLTPPAQFNIYLIYRKTGLSKAARTFINYFAG